MQVTPFPVSTDIFQVFPGLRRCFKLRCHGLHTTKTNLGLSRIQPSGLLKLFVNGQVCLDHPDGILSGEGALLHVHEAMIALTEWLRALQFAT